MTTNAANGVPLNALQDFLQSHRGIKYVRFSVIDYGNTNRTILVSRSRALRLAAAPGSGVDTGSPVDSCGMNVGGLLLELIRPGEDVWVPDWSTLRECAQEPAHAVCMCFIKETPEAEANWYARDPRSVLRRMEQRAKDKFGVDLLVGFEVEFTFLASREAVSTISGTNLPWTSAATRTPCFKIVEEVVDELEGNGVPVWAFHGEGSGGVFEISTGPKSPLAAVDALVYTHEAIKIVAHKHGYHATMHPKPFESSAPVGQHVHVSLSRTELGDHFLAGLLKHFRALCGLMLSSKDSYQRDEMFGSGSISFGDRNKLTPIKRVDAARFEIRPPDALSCSYLQLAAIIGAGMHGVEVKETLTMKPNQYVQGPALSTKQMKELGCTDYLPRDAAEALDEMEKDGAIKEALGEKCFDRYIYYKRKELEQAQKMSSSERRLALLENI